jgi:WD40 repeat protein
MSARILHFLCFTCFYLIAFSQSPEVSFQRGHNRAINALCFSHNDQTMATAGLDGKLIFWDVQSGREIRSIATDTSSLIKLGFSHDDSLLYGLSPAGYLFAWSVSSGALVKSLGAYRISDFEVLNDGGGVYFFGSSGCNLIDAGLKKIVASYAGQFYQVPAIDETQSTLVIVREDIEFACPLGKGEKMFDSLAAVCARFASLKTMGIGKRLGGIMRNAYNVQYDRPVGWASRGGKEYWEIIKAKKISKKTQRPVGYYSAGKNIFRIGKWKDNINGFVLRDKDVFVATALNGILVLDEKNGNIKKVLRAANDHVKTLKFTSDKKLLAAAYSDGSILLWDPSSGKIVRSFEGIQSRYSGIKFAGAKKIVSSTLSGDLRVWDFESNEMHFINLNNGLASAGKNKKFAVTGIEALRGDSIVLFSCLLARVNDRFIYTDRVYYNGEWNTRTNKVDLLEWQLNRDPASEAQLFNLKGLKDSVAGVVVSASAHELKIRSEKRDEIVIRTSHASPITGLAINPSYPYVSSCSWDGTIRHYDLKTGAELFVCGAFGKDNFFYFLGQGEYYVSKKALRYLSFSIGARTYPFEQFDLLYNRPDKVMKQIPGMDTLRLEVLCKAIEKRTLKHKINSALQDAELPELTVENYKKFLVTESKYSFSVKVKDSLSLIRRIHVSVNGVPEKEKVVISASSIDALIDLHLSYGENIISVFAENEEGLFSLKHEFTVKNSEKAKKPDLYIVCIGSGTFADTTQNLKYASKDAKDVSTFFTKAKMYNKIFPLLINGKEVNRDCLPKIKAHFSQAGKNDVVLLFFAGHGLLDKDLNYFLSSYDTDFSHPERNAIAYDSISGILSKSPARKRLFLLDACHSGELDSQEPMVLSDEKNVTDGKIVFRGPNTFLKSGASAVSSQAFQLSKFLFADLSASQGLSVISSAGGAELAMEGEKWKNGVFTYCLLNGLKSGKADLDRDRNISVSELLNFVNAGVVALTNGLQTPTGRTENLQLDFTIFK